MFGLGNNPPSEVFDELGRQAYSISQWMAYIQINNTLVPRAEEESSLSLNNISDRYDIQKCFDEIVTDNNLLEVEELFRRDLINEIALSVNQDTPQLYENTLRVLVALNWINYCFKCYYQDYPKSKKLLTLTNELAKVCVPAINLIFQEGLPESYRKIWPYLSSIMEQHRTAYS